MLNNERNDTTISKTPNAHGPALWKLLNPSYVLKLKFVKSAIVMPSQLYEPMLQNNATIDITHTMNKYMLCILCIISLMY